MSQFCGQCGTQHGPGTGSCVSCGAPIGDLPARSKTPWKFLGLMGAVVLGLLVTLVVVRAFIAPPLPENTPSAVAGNFALFAWAENASSARQLCWSNVPFPPCGDLYLGYIAGVKKVGTKMTHITVLSEAIQGPNAIVVLANYVTVVGIPSPDPVPLDLDLIKIDGRWKIDGRFKGVGEPQYPPAPPPPGKRVSVNLSTFVNKDLRDYEAALFPRSGGPFTIAEIPFTLATFGPDLHTAILQSPPNSAWSLSIPVNLRGVVAVYVMVNSAYGTCGASVGELDFVGAASAPFIYLLKEGTNVRDYREGSYCNSISDFTGSASFGNRAVRLDIQKIMLPASFARDTLQSINFKTYGKGVAGQPFLAAITVIQP